MLQERDRVAVHHFMRAALMLECLLCPCTMPPCQLYANDPPLSELQIEIGQLWVLSRAAASTCSLLKVAILFRPLLILASGLPACSCCCGAGGTLALASHGAGGTFEALSSSGVEAPTESAFPRARASSSFMTCAAVGRSFGSRAMHLLLSSSTSCGHSSGTLQDPRALNAFASATAVQHSFTPCITNRCIEIPTSMPFTAICMVPCNRSKHAKETGKSVSSWLSGDHTRGRNDMIDGLNSSMTPHVQQPRSQGEVCHLIFRREAVREGFSPESTSHISTPKLYTSTAWVTGALTGPSTLYAPNSSGLMYARVPLCSGMQKGLKRCLCPL